MYRISTNISLAVVSHAGCYISYDNLKCTPPSVEITKISYYNMIFFVGLFVPCQIIEFWAKRAHGKKMKGV